MILSVASLRVKIIIVSVDKKLNSEKIYASIICWTSPYELSCKTSTQNLEYVAKKMAEYLSILS